MGGRLIYLDHSATTAVDPRVVEAMLPYFSQRYGNPSSLYRLAEKPRGWLLRQARETDRRDPDRADRRKSSLRVAARRAIIWPYAAWPGLKPQRGRHIITTPIEHHAITHTCEQLEHEFGFRITYVPVDGDVVDPEDVGARHHRRDDPHLGDVCE
jgi:cysteine desulfurase